MSVSEIVKKKLAGRNWDRVKIWNILEDLVEKI